MDVYTMGTVRAAAAMTTSYVAGTVISQCQLYNQLVLYCYFTLGSLTSAEIKIEASLDGTNYVTETNITVSGGTVTMNKGSFTTTEDGNFKIAMPMSAQYVKVSCKGTGTTTGNSMGIDYMMQYV